MNSLISEAKATKVWFDDDSLWIELEDGRQLSVPKCWFPKLQNASKENLQSYVLIGKGLGIYWETLDEDISVPNLLAGFGAVKRKTKQGA